MTDNATTTGPFTAHIDFLAQLLEGWTHTNRLVDDHGDYAAPVAGQFDAVKLPLLVCDAHGGSFQDLVLIYGDKHVFAAVRLWDWDHPGLLRKTWLTTAIEEHIQAIGNATQELTPGAKMRLVHHRPRKNH